MLVNIGGKMTLFYKKQVANFPLKQKEGFYAVVSIHDNSFKLV